ncbi:MAG: hypothetical protein ABL908_20430 [Hyphomicrobium sp.]
MLSKALRKAASAASVPVVALGFLAIGAAVEPAAARKTACQVKYTGCNDRCFARYDDPVPCIHRTCDRQYDNCVAAEGGGKGKGRFSAMPAKNGTAAPAGVGPTKTGSPQPKQIVPSTPSGPAPRKAR